LLQRGREEQQLLRAVESALGLTPQWAVIFGDSLP
jgi:hypothetical protein